MAIETPEYKIISKREGCEVRRYSDIVIATKRISYKLRKEKTLRS